MGKKFIMVGGQKVYLKDGEPTPQVEEEADKQPEGDLDEKVDNVTEKIAKNLEAKLNFNEKIDALNEKVENLLNNHTKANSKLSEILGGKDIVKEKDKLTKEEKIVGFYHALVTGDNQVTKALSEGTAADGGYLFPDEFRAELVRWLAETNRMRSLVRVVPMSRDVLNVPSLVTSVKVYWTAENASKTTTSAEFGNVALTARKVAAILYASDELIEDSADIDIVNLIIQLFGEAIADEEDRVIIAGNGTTEPTGIATATIGQSVTCTTNLTFDKILDLVYALPQKYHRNASFLVNRENIKEMRKLKDSNGRYLWQDAIGQGAVPTLDGHPVYENNWVSVATIFFGDWKLAYWLGDRKQMTVKISQDTETAFTKDQTAIRVVERIGGNLVLAQAAAKLITIP